MCNLFRGINALKFCNKEEMFLFCDGFLHLIVISLAFLCLLSVFSTYLLYINIVAVVGVIFNEEQPRAIKESRVSFDMTFTLNATASQDVTIMINVASITAIGKNGAFNFVVTLTHIFK